MKFMFAVNGLKWLLSLGMLAAIPSPFLTRADEPAASAPSVGQAAANNAIVPVAWLEKDSYDWYERHAQVIEAQLTDKNGVLSRDIMSDGVHPTEAGYAIWGQALLAAGVLK